MDIISFGLGISSVVVIILIIVTVGTFFKLVELKEKINSLESNYTTQFDEMLRMIDINSELDNRRIDGEIDRTDKIADNIYRTIDSRLDKLELKLTDLNKGKKLING
jgi:cell division protein ZapA (FtsZ GTPase activity inhibitor)